jgi:hypothetical protein
VEIYRRGPWKGLEDVEFVRYNGSRLLEPLDYVPPAEFEQGYHDRQAAPVAKAASRNQLFSGKSGAVRLLADPIPVYISRAFYPIRGSQPESSLWSIAAILRIQAFAQCNILASRLPPGLRCEVVPTR